MGVLADIVSNQVISAFLDLETQTEGDLLAAVANDVKSKVSPGQSVQIPYFGAVTVNESESASVESVAPGAYTLTVDHPAVINVGIGWIDDQQGLDGAYAAQVAASCKRQMREHVFGKMLTAMRAQLVGPTNDVGRVINAGASAVTQAMVNSAEATLRAQKGSTSDCVFVGSPGATAAVKGLPNYYTPAGSVGMGPVNSLNGYRYVDTSLLESKSGDRSVATTASTIASNVGTQTVAANHGIIRGALVTTTGLTANASTATAVTATTATSVSCAITAGDGAQADGEGTVQTESGLILMAHRPWLWYAFAKGQEPEVHLIKREANAGWALQMTVYYGFRVLPSALVALHTPAI